MVTQLVQTFQINKKASAETRLMLFLHLNIEN